MNDVPFPLFHGTSTLFADRILNSSLGSQNPVAETNAVACLSQLLAVGDVALACEADWVSESYSLRHIAAQSVTGAGFNFRHGSTYLSPSEETAVRYALSNSHGSEIISACVALLNKLRVVAESNVECIEKNFPRIRDLSSGCFEPVLMRADSVPVSALRTEQGEANVQERIRWLLEFENPAIRDSIAQQENFEVVSSIEAATLTVWRIKGRDGVPLSVNCYQLVPYEDAT